MDKRKMAYCKDCGAIEEFEPDDCGVNYYQAVGECPFCQGPTYYKDGTPTKIKVLFEVVEPMIRKCRICGCTDDDCSGCIERTGVPCEWVEDDLCSACVSELIGENPVNDIWKDGE